MATTNDLIKKAMIRGLAEEFKVTELFEQELSKLRRELAGRRAVSDRVYGAYCFALAYIAVGAQEDAE